MSSAAHAGDLAHQGGGDRANLRRRRQHRLHARRHYGIHAGHLHFIVEVGGIAHAPDQNGRPAVAPPKPRDRRTSCRRFRSRRYDRAGGKSPPARRRRSSAEKSGDLAGVDTDGQHQPVGEPDGAPHHVEMAVGNRVKRPGKERNMRHSGGLARAPADRKPLAADERPFPPAVADARPYPPGPPASGNNDMPELSNDRELFFESCKIVTQIKE